jgi:hypothetical protein
MLLFDDVQNAREKRTKLLEEHKMKVNIKKLEKNGACRDGMDWMKSLGTTEAAEIIKIGFEQKKYQHLRYGLSYLMNKKQCVTWAIYCAESAIGIFEKKNPKDNLPRKAIDAAKAYLKNPCDRTKKTARNAAEAFAAYAAYAANAAAAYAAYAAAYAANAAFAANAYAAYAANAAFAANTAAREKALEDLIMKGYEILTGA